MESPRSSATPSADERSRSSAAVDLRWLAIAVVLISILREGRGVVPRSLPFFEVLTSVGSDSVWLRGLMVAVLGGSLLVLTPAWRMGCVIVGSALLLDVLGNMQDFSNGRLFRGLLLLLIGLAVTEFGVSIIRAQIIVMYLGSAISKLVDPDWWNGRFIESLLAYNRSEWSSGLIRFVSRPVGIAALTIETLIVVALVHRPWRNLGVFLVVVFHSFIVISLDEDFSAFTYVTLLATAALFADFGAVRAVRFPFPAVVRATPFSQLRRAARDEGTMQLTIGSRTTRLGSVPLLLLATVPGQLLTLGLASGSIRFGTTALRTATFALVVMMVLVVTRQLRGASLEPTALPRTSEMS